ncbi:MAG: S8 family serine peptidase [Anaerolineae bacterium]|nr:S8 family serine peptidase [Anaerolineae bacterium]
MRLTNGWGFPLLSFWLLLITITIPGAAWILDQLLFVQLNMKLPGYLWVIISLIHGGLVALPLYLYNRKSKYAAQHRSAVLAWGIAISIHILFSFIRLIPISTTQFVLAAQIVLSAIIISVLNKRLKSQHLELAPDNSLVLAILFLIPLLAIPFLLWGALGSGLDTLLSLVAGLLVGYIAGLVCDVAWLQTDQPRKVITNGFIFGVILLMIVSGYGIGGSQLLLIVCVPGLGFTSALITHLRHSNQHSKSRLWLPVMLLVGSQSALTMLFFDPKELTLFLMIGNDLLAWAFRAALSSAGLGILLTLGLWALSPHIKKISPRSQKLPVVLSFAAAIIIYFSFGQPGFFGDNLFVILNTHADLTQAAQMSDRDQRLNFIYSTLTNHAHKSQAPLIRKLDRYGVSHQSFYLINSLQVKRSPWIKLFLTAQPEVDRVLDSPRLRPLPQNMRIQTGGIQEFAAEDTPWNIGLIQAPRVWQELGITGAGIVIGHADSGVDGTHPAIRASYRGFGKSDDYNWLDPWNAAPSPADLIGHGTHTMGIMVGDNGLGVAPDAKWISCVNLARNFGNPGSYLVCMQFLFAPYPQGADPLIAGDPTQGAHIINNSWGCPPFEGCDAAVFHSVSNTLRTAGIFVTAAAGNTGLLGCATITSPLAIYDSVFTVGAVNKAGKLSILSSRGPVNNAGEILIKPDLVAPGENIFSSMPNNTYAYNTGTSMAAPHVSATVALMWSANPALIGNIDHTEQILYQTALHFNSENPNINACNPTAPQPNNDIGYGILDAYQAVLTALNLQ